MKSVKELRAEDYPDDIICEWLKVNNITEHYILEDETIYVVTDIDLEKGASNGVITARSIDKEFQDRTIPTSYPKCEVNAYDYFPHEIREWPLVESIETTYARLTK